MLLINGQRKTNLQRLKKSYTFELTEDYSYFNKKSGKLIRSNSLTIPAFYTKYDSKANDTVEIRYAETEQPYIDSAGKTNKKYAPHKVKFTRGRLVVRADQPDLYEFLINDPGLESNGGKKFRLKDPVAIAGKSVLDKKLLFEANKLIFGGKEGLSEVELRRVLLSAGNGDANDLDLDVVKDELLKIADNDPVEFVKMCQSKTMDTKVAFVSAMKKGIIAYEEKTNKFKWGAASGSKGDIVAVPRGQSVGDWFVDWLLNVDNTGVLNEINALLEGKVNKQAPTQGKSKEKATA
jgi:hypothetical protein